MAYLGGLRVLGREHSFKVRIVRKAVVSAIDIFLNHSLNRDIYSFIKSWRTSYDLNLLWIWIKDESKTITNLYLTSIMDLAIYPRIPGEKVNKKAGQASIIGRIISWSPKEKKMLISTN